MKRVNRWLSVLALVLLIAQGCGGSTPAKPTAGPDEPVSADQPTTVPEQPAGGAVEVGLAVVEAVDALILESMPVQVNVNVQGNLPDGCTSIGQATTQREGSSFVVTLTTTRPQEAICTQALVPYEEVVPLDVAGLPAGVYTVSVNGVSDTFELAMDNTAPRQ